MKLVHVHRYTNNLARKTSHMAKRNALHAIYNPMTNKVMHIFLTK